MTIMNASLLFLPPRQTGAGANDEEREQVPVPRRASLARSSSSVSSELTQQQRLREGILLPARLLTTFDELGQKHRLAGPL
jgi:hypothetical protein